MVCFLSSALLLRHEVSEDFFTIFRKLKNLDEEIHFVAASGRQYHSIVDKLQRVWADLTVIAENGGITKRNGQVLHSVCMDGATVESIIGECKAKLHDAYMVLCGEKCAYIERSYPDRFKKFFQEYYSTFQEIDDLACVSELDDTFLKIAICHFDVRTKNFGRCLFLFCYLLPSSNVCLSVCLAC